MRGPVVHSAVHSDKVHADLLSLCCGSCLGHVWRASLVMDFQPVKSRL